MTKRYEIRKRRALFTAYNNENNGIDRKEEEKKMKDGSTDYFIVAWQQYA